MEVSTFDGLPPELADTLIENRWGDAPVCTDLLLATAPSNARRWFIRGVLLRLAWRMDEAPLVVEPFDGSRPLRVGYVCSFWEAPTILFLILPVLKRHDPRRVHACLYLSGLLRTGETWRELYEHHVTAVREVDRLEGGTS